MSELSQTILAGTSQMADARKYANEQRQRRDDKKQVALQAASEAFGKVGDIFKQKQEEDDLKELSDGYSLGVVTGGAAGGLTAISAHRPRTAAAATQKISLTTKLEEMVRKNTLNPLEEAQAHHYKQLDETAQKTAEQKIQDEKDRDAWAKDYKPGLNDDEEISQIHRAVLTGQLSPKQAKPVIDDLRAKKTAAAKLAESDRKATSLTTKAEADNAALAAYHADEPVWDEIQSMWVQPDHNARLDKAIAAGASPAVVKLLGDQYIQEQKQAETVRNHTELASITKSVADGRNEYLKWKKTMAEQDAAGDKTDEQVRNNRIAAERLSKNAIGRLGQLERARVIVNNDPEMPADVKKTALAEIDREVKNANTYLEEMNSIFRSLAKREITSTEGATKTVAPVIPLTKGKLVKNAEGRWVKEQ